MKDRLKEATDKNKRDIDLYRIDADLIWPAIEHELNKNQGSAFVPLKILLRIAAVLVIGVGILFYIYNSRQNTFRIIEDFPLTSLSPELGETEIYYLSEIQEKMDLLQANHNQVDPMVWEDLSLLDSAFRDLRSDLEDNVDNEEVINAMIKNYKIKLEILGEILEEIQAQDEENQDDEELSI